MMMTWQDKFLTSQLDIVSSDPGKALAWLVLLSSLVTFLLGHLVYLALFGLLYVTWLYGDHRSLKSRDREEEEEEEEEEWLLDRFFCFLQQLDNGGYLSRSFLQQIQGARVQGGGEGHLASLCFLLIFPLLQTPSTSSRAAAEQQRSPRQQGRERRPAVLTPSSQLTPPPAWRGTCRARRTSSSSIVKIYEFSA